MKRLNLALALAAAALLALSGIAVAKDHRGDDHGHHRGRHHQRHHEFAMSEAGTISSFDAATGRLTIALAGGESVTGLVSSDTRINCEGVDDRRARRDHGGDNGGSASGDDNGGQFEPGDDNGGELPTDEATCSVVSLTAGAVVGEAELRLEGGMAVFEEVDLGFHS